MLHHLPSGEEEGHRIAYDLAREALRELNLEKQCVKAGADYISQEEGGPVARVKLLGEIYETRPPEYEVKCITKPDASIRLKILVLHYLAMATGKPLTGELIDFRQLPAGLSYHASFNSRVTRKLLNAFANDDGTHLFNAARALDVERVDYGDVGLKIWALPRVPVIIAFWVADEEFPANMSILFDSTISDYLSTEDVAVLGEQLAELLIERGRELHT